MRPVLNRWIVNAIDSLVAKKLEPCDAFIGMSGLFVRACKIAKTRYGAMVLLERGSTHILRQKEILNTLPGAAQVSHFDVSRELAGYNLADLIVIPSIHVENSFLDYNCSKTKLFRNPYGVNLDMFAPTPIPTIPRPTAIFVGNWNYRKGCDLWAKVLDRMPELHLIHVGGRGDAPFPNSSRFTHVDPVRQWDLREYYAKAHVSVLASREEGLSLVLVQALSCGLPLVCSESTGGRDLLELVRDDSLIHIFPVDDLDALCVALHKAVSFAMTRVGTRTLPEGVRAQLTWRAYGERYSQRLAELTKDR